jgi:formylglycine-generating enzyme required for sulfatase activity
MANVGDVAWYADNSGTGGGSYLSGGRPHEVKTKAPNSLGLYDMSGNVWEWCWDIYSSSNRVLRGGCWDRSASDCAVSSRIDGDPRNRNSYDGFRVVRKAP